jgi:inner membrane protein
MVGVLATRGRQPRKAIIYGAVLATLPDLDILQPFDNDLDATVGHRTWSHSWIVHLCVSPIFAYVLHRFDRSLTRLTWFALVASVFISHAALDALTIYGTGLFWPLARVPVMGGSIFIIDPLYTLPLLVTAIMLWRRPDRRRPLRLASIGIGLSSLYLGWGLFAQHHVEGLAAQSLGVQGKTWTKMVATPTPFNSVLWRVVALQENHFLEGFYAFTDSTENITMHRYPRNLDLKKQLGDQSYIEKFAAFNHGYYAIRRAGGQIVASDLRMGAEPYYFFQFVLADKIKSNQTEAGPEVQSPGVLIPRFANIPIDEWHLFSWIGNRLVSSDLDPMSQIPAADAMATPKSGGI